jgi:hypothetical protein
LDALPDWTALPSRISGRVGLCGDRCGHLLDVGALLQQHGLHVDAAVLGQDQLQQQLAAQVAEVRHRCAEPGAQLCPAGACGGKDGAVAAGDAGLLADRADVVAAGQLLERAIGERSRQRPHAADVARRLQMSGDREAVRGRGVDDAEARPFAEQQPLLWRSHAG